MKKRTTFSRLHLETLESRNLMAGLVSAVIQNGDLVITGDSADNYVAIYSNAGLTGDVTIGGGRPSATSAYKTLVNNSETPITLSGFTGGIRVNLGEGDDGVYLTDMTVAGNVQINLGNGNNTAVLSGQEQTGKVYSPGFVDNIQYAYDSHALRIQGNATINEGTSQDYTILNRARFDKDVVLNTGAGNDVIFGTDPVISGALKINAGAGNDIVEFNRSTPARPYNTAATTDLGSVQFSMGTGDDQVSFENTRAIKGPFEPWHIAGDFTISDRQSIKNPTVVKLENMDITGRMRIDLTQLVDQVTLTDIKANILNLHTYAGNDVININRMTTNYTLIDTSAGNDSLELNYNVWKALGLLTGMGDDIVTISGGSGDVDAELWGGNDSFDLIREHFSGGNLHVFGAEHNVSVLVDTIDAFWLAATTPDLLSKLHSKLHQV